jgi:hypothetical protein
VYRIQIQGFLYVDYKRGFKHYGSPNGLVSEKSIIASETVLNSKLSASKSLCLSLLVNSFPSINNVDTSAYIFHEAPEVEPTRGYVVDTVNTNALPSVPVESLMYITGCVIPEGYVI